MATATKQDSAKAGHRARHRYARITARKALGVGVAVAGVLVVLGPGTLTTLELDAHVKGDLLVLVSIAMWGLFTVLGKKATDELGALKFIAWVTLIGALVNVESCDRSA